MKNCLAQLFLFVCLSEGCAPTTGSATQCKAVGKAETTMDAAASQLSSLRQVSLAVKLAQYGKEHRSAEALRLSAQMLSEIPYTFGNHTPQLDSGAPLSPLDVFPRPEVLLQEANRIDGRTATIPEVGRSRGGVNGIIVVPGALAPKQGALYTLRMKGKESAIMGVVGGGNSDLDCYLYDETGALIRVDESPGDDCVFITQPEEDTNYRFKLVNRGDRVGPFVLATN